MNGLTVCVGFDDLLEITLHRNAPHFDRVLVMTSPDDERTQAAVDAVDNADWLATDAFTRDRATFNKGLAVEEGLDALGRDGWLVTFDADIVMPPAMELGNIHPDVLYGPWRRNLIDPTRWREYVNDPDTWSVLPRTLDSELGGYFHLFYADAPALGPPPWYGINWKHAGGYDSDFIARWPSNLHRRLPFEVLHLGEDGQNWWTRSSQRLDGSLPTTAKVSIEKNRQMRQARRRWNDYREEKLG